MSKSPATVYLGLGSNLGNRRQNLEKALGYIARSMHLTRKSSMYETEPVGNTEQPKFINMVCEAETTLTPQALLELTRGIEQKMGRPPRHPRDVPRTMDIDILFYGDQVFSTPELTIPHSRLRERAFVLVPLGEIAPGFVDPFSGETIAELLSRVPEGGRGIKKTGGC